jgi:hypothetical protein
LMANGFQGPPAVDFYSMLSGLGDTIAKKREQSAIAGAFRPGEDGTVDYNKALTTVAQYNPTLAVSMRNHLDQQKQSERDFAFRQTESQRAQSNADRSFGLQQRAADRADDPTPANFVKDPNTPGGYRPIGAADPAYIADVTKRKAEAEASVGGGKPIEFQTLGGSKFLVKQPGGGYTVVDPSTIGQPGPPVLSTPKVVGDAEGVATGLYDPPKAPGQRPPVQVADAQPSTFAGRFQGQPAQPVQAPQAPQQPVDVAAVDPQTGRRENWLKSQPGDVQAYIKKIADYEIDPRTTSIKGGHREQVLSAVAQYDPTYDQNSFGSRAKAIRDFSNRQAGQ